VNYPQILGTHENKLETNTPRFYPNASEPALGWRIQTV